MVIRSPLSSATWRSSSLAKAFAVTRPQATSDFRLSVFRLSAFHEANVKSLDLTLSSFPLSSFPAVKN
jgi:hypothetical protein